jgi:hypothetical protein
MAAHTAVRGVDGVWHLGSPAATVVVIFSGESDRQALERTLATIKITRRDLHFDSDAVREQFEAQFGSLA